MEPQQTELQLFEITKTESITIVKQNDPQISIEDKLVAPLAQILDEVVPSEKAKATTSIMSQSLKKSLDELFPEQRFEEKNIRKTKEILSSISDDFTSEQLCDVVTEVTYLIENCLNAFEMSIFDGQTLKELLHEKNI